MAATEQMADINNNKKLMSLESRQFSLSSKQQLC